MGGRLTLWLLWAYVVAVLVFLNGPLIPPLLLSIEPATAEAAQSGITFQSYSEIWQSRILVGSVETSLIVALAVGLITPMLAVIAGRAVRELGAPRGLVLFFLLPLFIPGVSLGVAMAFFFRQIGLPPSLLTIVIVHVMWALPFAFLIVLTSMATFDPVYVEAAYLCGANRWRAFKDVELPLIGRGVAGACLFSMIISFNETIRTVPVLGPNNTVQTYIWATYQRIGLSPPIYAMMGLLILTTLALVFVFALLGRARSRRPAN